MRIPVALSCVAIVLWLTAGASTAHAQETEDDLNPPPATLNAARSKVRQTEKQISGLSARSARETDPL